MTSEKTPSARRDALLSQCGGGLVLVRGQAPHGVNPNFVYLTGIAEPRAALLMSTDGLRIGTGRNHPGPDYVRGRMVHQLLFLPAADPLAARWGEDSAATTGSVDAAAAGFDAVLPIGDLGPLLEQALARAGVMHFVRGCPPLLAGAEDADAAFLARVRHTFFDLRLQDATPAVHEMRRVKDAGEVGKIEASLALTAAALDVALETLRGGLDEHEVEAEITRTYRAGGATHAFDPIVAAGANACLMHYTSNSSRIDPGGMLLIDTGAKLGDYCSDITRCYPVDGRFSDRQREIYETVLRAEREAIAICRPGTSLADVHARAWEVVDEAGFGKDFIHGTSHHLGLETHDAGDVHRPLEAGCVVTVEPGIYLTDERLGVRIEDDVLVTDGEPRVLSAAIPVEPGQIEERMA